MSFKREQLRFVSAVCGTLCLMVLLLGILLLASNIPPEITVEAVLLALWLALGLAGSLSLLAYSSVTLQLSHWIVISGLIALNIAMIVTILMAPLLIVTAILPIAVASLAIADLCGRKYGAMYFLAPILAVMIAIAYEARL